MKRFVFLVLVIFSLTNVVNAQFESAPAFPGAEGFARNTTTGGRGGTIIHVTNLNDKGTGSLRAALSGTAKKIIVFDVSGYIDLQSDLAVPSNTYIAGQTAPGDGITLRYRTVTFTKCDNVIVRYIRFRRSQIKDVNDGADACWGRNHKNIILDHCSFSWCIDEVASFYDNLNFTMQWCTLGEALANPGHSKGAHSYGGIWGGKGASFHHNFLCHMQNRVPRFNGARYNWSGYDQTKYENTLMAENVDFRNCVMYNWGTGGCYGGPGGGQINMVNNYYKGGPATTHKTQVTQVSVGSSGNASGYPIYWGYCSRYYINGNYVTGAGSQAANYDWKGVSYDSGLTTINGQQYMPDENHYYGKDFNYVQYNGKDYVPVKMDSAINAGYITTHSPEKAYEKVLAYCGASLTRDSVDMRYMDEARNGTTTYTGTVTKQKGIVDFINDPSGTYNPLLPSYPGLKAETRPAGYDTDKDGMPDEWEIANGLDPNSNADAKTYTLDPKKYYTNVEVYLNWVVEEITKECQSDYEQGFEEYYPEVVNPYAGDANKDNVVDVADITTIAGYILNPESVSQSSAAFSKRNADVNGDGVVDVADITAAAEKILSE